MTAFLDAPHGQFYKKIKLHYFAPNFVYELVDRNKFGQMMLNSSAALPACWPMGARGRFRLGQRRRAWN